MEYRIMKTPHFFSLTLIALLAVAAHAEPLPGTKPLENPDDLSVQMVAGIGRYLDRETAHAAEARLQRWKARDAGQAESDRKLLRERLGMSDAPASGGIEVVQPLGAPPVES